MSYQPLYRDPFFDSAKVIGEALAAVEKLADRRIDSCVDEAASFGAEIWRSNLAAGTLASLEMWRGHKSTTIILEDFLDPSDFQHLLPPTPVWKGVFETERQMRWADVLLLGLMRLLDMCPASIHAENEGYLVRNVIASQTKTDQQSSHGSRKPFTWHSDQLNCNISRTPIRAACPDALCFFVARNAEQVNTRIVANEDVIDELKFKSVRRLRQHNYTIKKPESNDAANDELFPTLYDQQVIIQNDHDRTYFIRFDPQAVTVTSPSDKEHAAALRDLRRTLSKLKVEPIVFKPGQFVIFKNRRVLHSRDAFSPHEPLEESRWLRRIYGVYTNVARSSAQAG